MGVSSASSRCITKKKIQADTNLKKLEKNKNSNIKLRWSNREDKKEGARGANLESPFKRK